MQTLIDTFLMDNNIGFWDIIKAESENTYVFIIFVDYTIENLYLDFSNLIHK